MHYENLPQGIQRELDQIVMKAGEVTPVLRKAVHNLTRLLSLSPEQFEVLATYAYAKMDQGSNNMLDIPESDMYIESEE